MLRARIRKGQFTRINMPCNQPVFAASGGCVEVPLERSDEVRESMKNPASDSCKFRIYVYNLNGPRSWLLHQFAGFEKPSSG